MELESVSSSASLSSHEGETAIDLSGSDTPSNRVHGGKEAWDDIREVDLLAILHAELQVNKFGEAHFNSFNSLVDMGAEQIITGFTSQTTITNRRDSTTEDKNIKEIQVNIKMSNVKVQQATHRLSSKPDDMVTQTPQMCELIGLTYKIDIICDITITADAIYQSGEKHTRTEVMKAAHLTSIPCLVKSSICVLNNMTREAQIASDEDPNNPGGYFIVNGGRWIASIVENIANNKLHVYYNEGHKKEVSRLNILSKEGDRYQNSYQLLLRFMIDNAITIELQSTKHDKCEIPFYIIFRALGMTSDKEIVEMITGDAEGDSADNVVVNELKKRLSIAFGIEDHKFASVKGVIESNAVLYALGLVLNPTADRAAIAKDDNMQKYIQNSTRASLDKVFLPHIGTTPDARIKKLRFLGYMIFQLLCVGCKFIQSTSRDSPKNKRYLGAGINISKTLKSAIGNSTSAMIKKITNAFTSATFGSVNMGAAVLAAISATDINKVIQSSITAGSKSMIKINGKEIKNKMGGKSFVRKNLSFHNVSLITCETPDGSPGGKLETRAVDIRMVQPQYPGQIDPVYTPEAVPPLGLMKAQAVTSSITDATVGETIKSMLYDDRMMTPMMHIKPSDIEKQKLARVFVNGDWIGCCSNPFVLAAKYRKMRRDGLIHHQTSIGNEVSSRELHFWTDFGRLIRPLIIVYNNIAEFRRECRERLDKVRIGQKTQIEEPVFKQWIKLTKQHLDDLRAGRITMTDLRKEGVIEYISATEQDDIYIAQSIRTLREHRNNPYYQYTHMEIEQAILSIASLSNPNISMSMATRNSYATNHWKQSVQWAAMNSVHGKNISQAHNLEYPIACTFGDAYSTPSGVNLITAICLSAGKGSDDSAILSASAVACGAHNASFYNMENVQLSSGEQYGNADFARTMNIKDGVYDVENDCVRPGTIITNGHVLVVKSASLPQPIDNVLYKDTSVSYTKNEPVIVSKVITSRNDRNMIVKKVMMRSFRPADTGDKLASRTGNKSTISVMKPRGDLLYTKSGMKVSLQISCFSFITRQALNQMREIQCAAYGAMKGGFFDCTPFLNSDLEALLRKDGIDPKDFCYEYLYDGTTGERTQYRIFVGPCFNVRLPKYPIDEQYDNNRGRIDTYTHQPADGGKAKDGGLKLGEMEKDVMMVHGNMSFIFEKMLNDSCGTDMYVCSNCRTIMTVNFEKNIYKCRCQSGQSICRVKSNWIALVINREIRSANIVMKFNMGPTTFVC